MCEVHLTRCPNCARVEHFSLAPCARVSEGHQQCGNRRAVLDGPSPLCEQCQRRAHRWRVSVWQRTKQTARRIRGALVRVAARRRSSRIDSVREEPEEDRVRLRDYAATMGRRAHSAMAGRMNSLRRSRTRRVTSLDVNVLNPWKKGKSVEETRSKEKPNEEASNAQQESSPSLGLPIQRSSSSVYSTQPSFHSESVWSQISLPPHIVEELLWADQPLAVAPAIPARNPNRASTPAQPLPNAKRNTFGLQETIDDEGTFRRTERRSKSWPPGLGA